MAFTRNILFVLAILGAAVAPMVSQSPARPASADASFPGWPATFEGQPLSALPLGAREAAFAQDFPGRVGRFSDGRREIILRWVAAPTRMLHPASDCFRGSGYAIAPQPLRTGSDGRTMSCFRAARGGTALYVCEHIRSADNESWSDVSSWYWSALLDRSQGPWWSVVIAETTAQ
ncbi:MAG: hypothetical protein ACT4N2_15845 [Hyphomicrobium sp.]